MPVQNKKRKKYDKEFGTSNIKKARRFWKYMRFGLTLAKFPPIGHYLKKFMGVKESNGSTIPINKSLELPDDVVLPFIA